MDMLPGHRDQLIQECRRLTLSGIPASILATCEVVIYCLAAFVLFRRRGNSISESCAYALITPLMLLSALFQLAFIAGTPLISAGIEIPLTLAAGVVVYRLRGLFREGLRAGRDFIAANPISGGCIALLGLYLLLAGFVLPPESQHWPGLVSVLHLQKSGSITAALSPAPPAAASGPLPPLNIVILSHLFLRFHTDLGLGLFGFMAYLCIGFCSYALARRYAWPPTAFTLALMVVSMPRIVLLSTTPGEELLPAAAALFCLLAVYRAIERPNRMDLLLLLCSLLFTISGSALDAAFPAVMILLAAVLLFRRHGFITWWKLLVSRPQVIPIALAVFLLFSQLWLAAFNHVHLGRWFGSTELASFVPNADGIQGALANLVRYVFSSAHFTRPLDLICNWAFGFTMSGALQRFYEFLAEPVFGDLGAAGPFAIFWLPDERIAWFGPFGFLLVLPAVAYAALRATRRLKAIAVGLWGYFFLVMLVAAWCPDNVRFFTLFFVCSGFSLALFLPPWYLSPAGRRRLQEAAILLVIYASVFNLLKPAVTVPKVITGGNVDLASYSDSNCLKACRPAVWPRQSAWVVSQWGRNRLEPSTRVFADHRVAEIAALVPKETPLRLICRRPEMMYPFLMAFPRAVVLEAAALDNPYVWGDVDQAETIILFVDLDPGFADQKAATEVLWRADPSRASCGGALVRIRMPSPDGSTP